MTEDTSDRGQFKAILVYKAASGPTIFDDPDKAMCLSVSVLNTYGV
jgi:hypothetical protein